MSNSTGQASPGPQPEAAADPSAADPSMEDILASIRRILSEDEAAGPGEASSAAAPLVLDATMLVREPHQASSIAPVSPLSALSSIGAPGAEAKPTQVAPAPTPVPVAAPSPVAENVVEPPAVESNMIAAAPVAPSPTPEPESAGLVAPETAAAAASSMGTLMRTLAAERQSAVYRGGPTIEDLVREQIRPILKQWLDTHLPPLVERLVRSEIERVVGRAVS